jgi:hypothetical protein
VGLIGKEDMARNVKFDPAKLIGIKRVIEIERKVGKDKPADSRQYTNIAYGRYYTEDRPEIPVTERVRLGLPLLPGQVVPPAAPPQTSPATTSSTPAKPSAGTAAPSPAFDPSEV